MARSVADTDNNGEITEAEFSRIVPEGTAPEQATNLSAALSANFARLDTDSSGTLSPTEFAAHTDVDGDNAVSHREYKDMQVVVWNKGAPADSVEEKMATPTATAVPSFVVSGGTLSKFFKANPGSNVTPAELYSCVLHLGALAPAWCWHAPSLHPTG